MQLHTMRQQITNVYATLSLKYPYRAAAICLVQYALISGHAA